MLMEFFLARSPNVPVIKEMAEKVGVRASRLKKQEDTRCILCGLCVRVCEEMVGVSAISFANRGIEREVGTPFGMDSDVCIGCGGCTYVCPTSCIEMIGEPYGPGGRRLNMGDLTLDICPHNHECGTCELESQFFEEMKHALAAVRKEIGAR